MQSPSNAADAAALKKARAYARKLVAQHGVGATAKALQISRSALLALAAGSNVHRGTVLAVSTAAASAEALDARMLGVAFTGVKKTPTKLVLGAPVPAKRGTK